MEEPQKETGTYEVGRKDSIWRILSCREGGREEGGSVPENIIKPSLVGSAEPRKRMRQVRIGKGSLFQHRRKKKKKNLEKTISTCTIQRARYRAPNWAVSSKFRQVGKKYA